LLEERTLVRKGIIKLDEAMRTCVNVAVLATVTKLPDNRYVNASYQKEKGFFARWQALAGETVLAFGAVEFEKQQLIEWRRPEIQLTVDLACEALRIKQYLQGGVGGIIPPIVIPNPEPVAVTIPLLDCDRIVFALFANTTLFVQVVGEEVLNACDLELLPVQRDVRSAATGSALTPTPNPDIPGESLPDEPYDDDTDDDGETYDPVEDTPPAPVLGTWTISVLVNQPSGSYTDTSTYLGDSLPLPFVQLEAGSWYLKYYQNGSLQQRSFGPTVITTSISISSSSFAP
jgi:hypothetical protein